MGWFSRKEDSDEPSKSEIIKDLKSKVKGLESQLESERKGRRYDREDALENARLNRKEFARGVGEAAGNAAFAVKKAKQDADEEVRLARVEARDEIDQYRIGADERVREAERSIRDVDLAVMEAEIAMQIKHNKEILALEIRVAKAEGNVNAESVRADASETMAETIVSLLNDYKEEHSDLVDSIFEKIPTVTLDKFNIQVTVPPAEVTVLNGGGQKQEQKNK